MAAWIGGPGSVNYYLDGWQQYDRTAQHCNIAPNPDAVEEFRVITNSYSAEYGRFASGVLTSSRAPAPISCTDHY